jgi:hypothetical protein
MGIFFATFIIMALAVLGMAAGVMLGRSPIKGSCGGLNKIAGIDCACSQPCEKRRRAMRLAPDRQPLHRA